MVRAAGTAACLLALSGRTSALRAKSSISQLASGQPYRMEMENHWDLQYVADLKVGGQGLTGIWDTGSFDLVVFSTSCMRCGTAAAYDEHASRDMRWGLRSRSQNYGSGSCNSNDVTDKVAVGPFSVKQQDMWVAKDCNMPLLGSAAFESIVGIGPPGHLGISARSRLEQVRRLQEDYENDGAEVPKTLEDSMRHATEDIEDAKTKRDLLTNLGVQTFSACYGRAPGAPGWLIWNDATRSGHPGVKQVHVEGLMTWGVKLGQVGFKFPNGKHAAMSCQDGCGAIVDTGTSLLGVPSIIYNRLLEALGAGDAGDGATVDCSNIQQLPKLLLTMGEHSFYLHPQTYLGKMYGGLSSDAVGFVRSTKQDSAEDRRGRCQLLLMDLGSRKTQFGPMFILGLPFMREFYTTFDLGATAGHRSLFISQANDQCDKEGGSGIVEGFRHERQLLSVDASKIRLPGWLGDRDSSHTI